MKIPATATKLQKMLKLLSIEIDMPPKSTLLYSPELSALVKPGYLQHQYEQEGILQPDSHFSFSSTQYVTLFNCGKLLAQPCSELAWGTGLK